MCFWLALPAAEEALRLQEKTNVCVPTDVERSPGGGVGVCTHVMHDRSRMTHVKHGRGRGGGGQGGRGIGNDRNFFAAIRSH